MELKLKNIDEIEANIDLGNIDYDNGCLYSGQAVPGWHTNEQIKLEYWYIKHIDDIVRYKAWRNKVRAARARMELNKQKLEEAEREQWENVIWECTHDLTNQVVEYQRNHSNTFFAALWKGYLRKLVLAVEKEYKTKMVMLQPKQPRLMDDEGWYTEIMLDCLSTYRYNNDVPARFETYFQAAVKKRYARAVRDANRDCRKDVIIVGSLDNEYTMQRVEAEYAEISTETSMEHHYEIKEMITELKARMKNDNQRKVIDLMVDCYTQLEISKMLDIPLITVKRYWKKIREAAAEMMTGRK